MTRPLLYPDGPLVSHTIGIPAALLAELRAEAAARRVSIATVIRERLEARRPEEPARHLPPDALQGT